MTEQEIKVVLDKHKKWVNGEDGGERADLRRAYLRGAYLRGADLRWADLRWAYLRGADLRGADLRGACLSGACLSDTKIDLETVNKYFPLTCPESGAFIGWKKSADNMIVKLQITEDSKRSSAFGRKCRCSKAVVLAIENLDGTPTKQTETRSKHSCLFVYEVGKTVEVPDFDEDRRHECAPGIHFFITRQEAVDY